MNKPLFKQVDTIRLVLFRGVFGAIARAWVKRVLVDPEFTFNFMEANQINRISPLVPFSFV